MAEDADGSRRRPGRPACSRTRCRSARCAIATRSSSSRRPSRWIPPRRTSTRFLRLRSDLGGGDPPDLLQEGAFGPTSRESHCSQALHARSGAPRFSAVSFPTVQTSDGRLLFSPTDLNGFLSCEHLTTLQLAVARGELKKPFRPNLHADLIQRKGEEHEAAYLARLRAEGASIAEIDFDDRDWERAARETERGHPRRRRRRLPGRPHRRHLARVRGLHRAPPRRLGYEVVDTKLARLAKPQHVLQLCFYTEQLARIQGRAARGHARRHRASASASPSGPTTSSPTTAGSGSGFSTRSSGGGRPTRTRSTSAGSATSSRSARSGGPRTTTSRSSPACRGSRSSGSTAAGITTLEALAEADPTTKVRSMRATTFEGLNLQARLQLHHRAHRRARDRPPPRGARPRLRAAARAEPGRRLARPRGRPVVRAGARARVPDRLDRARRGRRAALRAHLGARPRGREGGLRAVRRPRRRAPPALPRPARLPLRAVRAHRALAAHGRARHARGRDRRPAPRRGARRPLPRDEAGAARVGAELLDQGGREALRLRADGRGRRAGASR